MGLKTYLLISSVLNLALFFVLSVLADQNIPGPYPRPFFVLCPLVIAMFQVSAVLPRARAVPAEQRTNYWSYRDANKPTAMLIVVVAFSAAVVLIGD
ncbi:MAG: hypothetical protein BGO57_16175 [Sphingomonadales bacterium 63-6]|nr:MAG: hypothetical protein BGO57_16175 [Sphingomonadales bacterium 63-6]